MPVWVRLLLKLILIVNKLETLIGANPTLRPLTVSLTLCLKQLRLVYLVRYLTSWVPLPLETRPTLIVLLRVPPIPPSSLLMRLLVLMAHPILLLLIIEAPM